MPDEKPVQVIEALTDPKAVIFDFGDTILHEGPVDLMSGVGAVLSLARRPEPELQEQVALALSELLDDLDPRRQASQIELPPETVWRLVYEPLGLAFDAEAAEIEWAFWSAATTWSPEPDVDRVLAALVARGIPVSVLSNTMFRERTIARQLRESGITTAFEFIMTSADYVLRKPHRRLFDLAARRLRTDPSDIWFIGDSVEYDMDGAAGAGMVPIWYARGRASPESNPAAHVISDWGAFLNEVARISSPRGQA